ncbi:MAG: V-type ATPase subunit [Actinobacteria bacterium]|nr:V-type ATPase subunit [Actinomycetota bacterium]
MYRKYRLEVDPLKEQPSPQAEGRKLRKLPDYLRIDLGAIKPFHETLRYGHAVGRIRAQEMKLLMPHHIGRLIEADFQEALHILDEVEMGDYLAGSSTAREVDDGLINYLHDVYEFLRGALPKDSVLFEFFQCRYDFHNLKVLLKARLEGTGEEALLSRLGRMDVEVLRRGVENPLELPSPYKEVVMEVVEREPSPQETETVIDRHYLRYRLYLARREGSEFLVEFARTCIDFANLKAMLRARRLGKDREALQSSLVEGGYIPISYLLEVYGDSDEVMLRKLEQTRYSSRLLELLGEGEEKPGLSDFDRRSDDYIMDMLRASRRISVGVEPVFSFVRARENEVTMVRMLLMAKLHNLAPEVVEKMLRKPYLE